jgi:hypothetical protein
MIHANELRIGNKIKVYTDIVDVTDIGDDGTIGTTAYFDGQMGCCGCTDSMADPIPLTPEILEKCGFEKDKVTGDYWDMVDEYGCSKQNFVIFHYEDGTFSVGSSLGEYSVGKQFKYLHQLQNLYFALTGEELEVKL